MVHNSEENPYNHSISIESLNRYKHFLYGLNNQVNQLEKQVKEVEQFYQSIDDLNNDFKNKGWEKPPTGSKKPLQRALEEMQEEIIRHFSKMLSEITQHRWAWPFLEPVDVEGLGLDDYFEIIKKPMDFSTIKIKMEAKDGSGYKNVREIYADVRLIFNNAMKYNDENSDTHKMSKTLLDIFEKKWLLLLPKVVKAESELSKEEARENLTKKLAQENAYANMTRKLNAELSKADMTLTNLKTTMIAKCRKLSPLEKPLLAAEITKLSPDNLRTALEILNENNPNFQYSVDNLTTEDVTLDLDSQSNYNVWRLYMFVKNALELQDAASAVTQDNNIEEKESDAKRRRMV
ncbi:transcription factor GTE1-like [Vicia villosa]|uniref:transcription factor GTE1-like n=1 Tax=Vicia villosa TaxID=3911 RepID=UPI00273BFFF0|nr:transcription factor GTE1-like [Vicia villosa]